VPDDARVERVSRDDLPRDSVENTAATQAVGDAWLARASTALLAIPSAVVPETFNVLLNPAHQDAARIAIVQATDHVIDPRLLS
jgi:RES domain-containing protein